MTPPLTGLRVLDLSRVLAGPYCTMVLADLGADVVKVERPGGGDETRAWGPPYAGGEAAYFLAVNRSKRSIALDLKDPADVGTVRALAERADVVVENFKAGGAERLGLDFETLRAAKPDLVYCSISGFGHAREPAGRPGYDFVAQAESGLMAITGHEEPAKVGVAVVDVLAGYNAAVGILAALRRRDATGEGEHVRVSLLDSGLAALVNVAANALVTGEEPRRYGNAHPSIVPYETFRAADGLVALAAANDGLFARACTVLECPELAADPRFSSNPARVEHREELVPLLEARFATRPAAEWVAMLADAGVPAGRVRGVREAFAAAAAAGDPATVRVQHPTAGELELVRSPIYLTQAGTRPAQAPPRLGEHTAEVLSELRRSPG